MKALLLAAGLGTRLQPYTEELPKCLFPIQGEPILEHWINLLRINGFKDIYINTHYLSNQVIDFIKYCEIKYKININILHETELLGTAGTISKNYYNLFDKEELFVAHVDNWITTDLKSFFSSWKLQKSIYDIGMVTFKSDSPESCGIVNIDESNIVIEFLEKVKYPPHNIANGAIYILSKNACSWISKHSPKDISIDVIPEFLGNIWAWQINGTLRDIGSVESWLKAQKEMPKLLLPKSYMKWNNQYSELEIHKHIKGLMQCTQQ
ncbi:MAG: nucleotidyltransferase family protein [Amylibacter sp.]